MSRIFNFWRSPPDNSSTVYTCVRGTYCTITGVWQKNQFYGAPNLDILCYKCNKEIDVPVTEDGEFFWINKTVPMINKKYCKIRANINSSIKGEYFGEYYLDLFSQK